MNKEELIKRLEDIEWEDFEVKEAKNEIPKNSWETVSAFSNTSGGWLIFGVKKIGMAYEIVGVENPEKITHDFTTILLNGEKFNKRIEVMSKKYAFSEGIVLAFKIPCKQKIDKPVFFNSQNNTFIRTAGGNQRATQEEINSMFRSSSFEVKDCEQTKFLISDLDEQTTHQYRNYFASVNPGHRFIGISDPEFLEKIGAVIDGKVTYAGLLVFGKIESLMRTVPNYRIEYLEVPGTSYSDAKVRYNHRISSEKNLFSTFFDIYEQLSRKIDIPFSVKGGFRDDDPPHLQALREALVNLLMHTDYFSHGNPRIRIFNDRYEFFNPGGLPKDLEYILKENYSQPRNPSIAKMFRLVRLSENIGSGFDKMISGWKKHYTMQPFIDGGFDRYSISFPRGISGSTSTKNGIETSTKTVDYSVYTSRKKSAEQEIIHILRHNPHFTAREISVKMGLSVQGVRYHLVNLKKKGLLERKGGRKKGLWEIKRNKGNIERGGQPL